MKENEKKGMFHKVVDLLCGSHVNDTVNAMDAFMRTKYGDIKSPQQYIEVAQRHIKRMIMTRINPESYNTDEPRFRSYCCVVDFDPEMSEHIPEIFAPFVESGFNIVKLSGRISEVGSEELYLISWDKRA